MNVIAPRFSSSYSCVEKQDSLNTMLADVVFPAAAGAYVANLFVPLSLVLAMVAEYGIYVYFQRGIISLWRLLFIVLGVNVFSWLVGAFVSGLIPDSFVPRIPHLPAVYDLSVLVWASFFEHGS